MQLSLTLASATARAATSVCSVKITWLSRPGIERVMVTSTFGLFEVSTTIVSPLPVLKPLTPASMATAASTSALIASASVSSVLRSSSAPASAEESTADWTSRLFAYHRPTSIEAPAKPMSTGAAIAK